MSQFSIFCCSFLAALAPFNPNLDGKSHEETAVPAVQLTIHVYDYARLPDDEYEPARAQADRILSHAGVPTRWLRCALAPAEAADPGCKAAITPTDLVLRILPADMAVRVPVTGKVFGYAVPSRGEGFGTVVSVFHHRVADLITQKRRRAGGRLYSKALVLGYILAHELGHVLLGPNSHSRGGIMAFPWGPKQLEGCLRGGVVVLKIGGRVPSEGIPKAATGKGSNWP